MLLTLTDPSLPILIYFRIPDLNVAVPFLFNLDDADDGKILVFDRFCCFSSSDINSETFLGTNASSFIVAFLEATTSEVTKLSGLESRELFNCKVIRFGFIVKYR